MDLYEECIKMNEKLRFEVVDFRILFKSYLYEVAPFFKHLAYKSEAEIRIIFTKLFGMVNDLCIKV